MIAYIVVILVLMGAGLFGTASNEPLQPFAKALVKCIQLGLFCWSIYLLVTL